jgi:hypothetical protein
LGFPTASSRITAPSSLAKGSLNSVTTITSACSGRPCLTQRQMAN